MSLSVNIHPIILPLTFHCYKYTSLPGLFTFPLCVIGGLWSVIVAFPGQLDYLSIFFFFFFFLVSIHFLFFFFYLFGELWWTRKLLC